MVMQNGSEERGEVNLQSLSPPMHLLVVLRVRQVEREVAGATTGGAEGRREAPRWAERSGVEGRRGVP